MKITAKTTKEQLVKFLGANEKSVKKQDKDLFSRISYAEKMMKTDESKVTKKDLVDLAREVIKLLGEKVAEPALAEEPAKETPAKPKAENSIKGSKKSKSKKEEVPVEEAKEEESEPEEKEEKVDKKSAKKSLGKKKAKKDGVTVLEGTENDKTVQMAKMFPQTLEVGDTKYELATDIENMEDLYKAYEDEQEIVFAYYWTKRHLKQFPYFGTILGQPKSFDNDLDLATAIYVSDEKKVAYLVSMYTEAVYTAIPSDFEVDENGVRFAGGIEYQIYKVAK